MIGAQTPGTIKGLTATPVKVRGTCGHEWTPVTTKAALIRGGGTSVKLNCPKCVELRDWSKAKHKKARGREILRTVTCAEPPVRYCTAKGCLGGPTKLNIYNSGSTCGPCQHRAEKARAWKVADTETRILWLLEEKGHRTAAGIHETLLIPLLDVSTALFELKGRGKVEWGGKASSGMHFWKLTVDG